jgi:uncharacterized sodium:solute symporter family permease YidK
MIALADSPVASVLGLVSALLVPIVGLITWIGRAIFKYLIERIRVLEGREQTTLTDMVDSVENMAESVKITADFTNQLVEEMKYRERRRQEDARERSETEKRP